MIGEGKKNLEKKGGNEKQQACCFEKKGEGLEQMESKKKMGERVARI